jgi:hypothetical protein
MKNTPVFFVTKNIFLVKNIPLTYLLYIKFWFSLQKIFSLNSPEIATGISVGIRHTTGLLSGRRNKYIS